MRNRNNLALGLAAIALVVAVGAMIYTAVIDERGEHLVTWNLYHGELQSENIAYNVEIDEADHGYGFRRLVHLRLVDSPSYVGITGHDYDNDGKWDRVFYCGNHELVGRHPEYSEFGCNSVIRTASGWKFEPCPADEGVVQPFSDRAISFAIAELDLAMSRLHNEDNLSQRWEWNSEQKKVVKIFDRRG
ncbi:MAG: hypothetical protein QY304_01620 [Candidatus Paceibacterota bacterium]|nr:MAG: hypothetical protein QY304_01620 [Candidatus Paceibacterota bacterium]